MARNQTLLKILTDMRGEARLSMNSSHNLGDRDAQIGLLQREQERLWADHDWPHLMVSRYLPAEAGRRYYDPRAGFNERWEPKGDLSMERISDVAIFDGHLWRTLNYGIGDHMRFSHDSLAGEVSWPPRAWQRYEGEVLEIWPMPDESGVPSFDQSVPPEMQAVIRIRGVRDLRPFRDDDDRADLDDRLLALYGGAAILAEAGAKDTNLKLEAAQRHYLRIKGDQDQREPFSLFGTRAVQHVPRPYVSRYRRPE